jgi:hypothetical protein
MTEDVSENLSDLNKLALREFILLVSQNDELSSRLKNIILQLSKDGIPQDLDPLDSFTMGGNNDQAQTD